MSDRKKRREFVNKTKGQVLRLPCRTCATRTNHVVQLSLDVEGQVEDWLQWWRHHQIVQCRGCDEISFRLLEMNTEDVFLDEEGIEQLIENVEMYPPRVSGRLKLQDQHLLPYSLRQLYEETHKALANKQPILAGVGMRALIEALCHERSAEGDNLKARINALVSQGVLTKDGADILHSLRDLGNDAAYEATLYSEADLSTAFDVVEHLLQGIYLLPHKAAGLQKTPKKQ